MQFYISYRIDSYNLKNTVSLGDKAGLLDPKASSKSTFSFCVGGPVFRTYL